MALQVLKQIDMSLARELYNLFTALGLADT